MYDFYRGREAWEVIERDDGFVSLGGGPATYFASYEEWPSHQRRGIRLAKGKVLDIGCGAGRVAVHLQAQGLDVVGIDTSPFAVKVCKLRGLKKARLLSIMEV
jgi:2-polyprenyl-3-methyl-5-hydroxy-6-metoxy-1,4-benzoquinol methylase